MTGFHSIVENCIIPAEKAAPDHTVDYFARSRQLTLVSEEDFESLAPQTPVGNHRGPFGICTPSPSDGGDSSPELSVLDGQDAEDLDWSSFRVAVVDDNFINSKIICKHLKRLLGIVVQEEDIFENGKTLIDALAHTQYDTILLDIEMPIMDGMEATVRIRKGLPSPVTPPSTEPQRVEYPIYHCDDSETEPDLVRESSAVTLHHIPSNADLTHEAVLPSNVGIPIIACTTNAQAHHRKHYLSIGMDSVVGKPLNPDLLIRVVKYHLRRVYFAQQHKAPLFRPSSPPLHPPSPRSLTSSSSSGTGTFLTAGPSPVSRSPSQTRLSRILDSVLEAEGISEIKI
ncbi:uncharacterized protein EV422DRAFT_605688 [Fimicolochytrium jonesii]|uniref:uncharacterized protein n=1 Tax=Fimicolochytrium jonesii TaxID=1396493 RepID=UPI0022FEB623|nr:uncharacterized protein EV422DRAFT_605688 [Fimicolochytrium jonesii]KAI8825077.1 hypothetical protein EV422DRAFT_605688 [Fimicolochytrium jonesii]